MRLMQSIREFLTKPHPFIFNWSSVVIPGLVTFFVMLTFKPFGLGNLEFGVVLRITAFLSILVSLVVWGMVFLLQKTLSGWFDRDSWNIGRELGLIVIVLIVIACLIFAFARLFFDTSESTPALFIGILVKTITVSILPILLMVLFEQYSHNRKQLKAALKLSEELRNMDQLSSVSNVIQIHSENGKLVLQLESNELVMMQSDGNYVDVYHLDQGNMQKSIIRNRLKTLSERLPKDVFFQCHKRFVINGHQVLKVEGNARNLELSLRGIDEKIPVSRANNQAIASFLSELSN